MVDRSDGQSADQIEDFNTEAAKWSPSQQIAEQVVSANRVKNPDDVVGMCSECGSTIDGAKMEKNIFANEGYSPPCPYCGGVVIVVYQELVEAAYNQITAARGAQ